jgi:hypothetical protein
MTQNRIERSVGILVLQLQYIDFSGKWHSASVISVEYYHAEYHSAERYFVE